MRSRGRVAAASTRRPRVAAFAGDPPERLERWRGSALRSSRRRAASASGSAAECDLGAGDPPTPPTGDYRWLVRSEHVVGPGASPGFASGRPADNDHTPDLRACRPGERLPPLSGTRATAFAMSQMPLVGMVESGGVFMSMGAGCRGVMEVVRPDLEVEHRLDVGAVRVEVSSREEGPGQTLGSAA
jgi:hypothetical protein